MFLVWIQRGRWTHVADMPHASAQEEPPGWSHTGQRTAVDQGRI